MLLTRQQLGTFMFASTDASHAALGNLRVDPDGLVWATNGHVLVRIKNTGTPPDEVGR